MITAAQLNARLGQSISLICPNGYSSRHDNHCAHFVSHMLGFSFGATCRMMAGGASPGANIRVHELFARCPQVGTWSTRPAAVTEYLVFITLASNVNLKTGTMANVPKKHVGIHVGGLVWHYSNSQGKVVVVSPDAFSRHYTGTGFALFYGTFPA